MGQALQSSDLAGAQAAFAELKSSLGHHASAAAQPGTPAVIVNIGGGQNATGDVTGAESIFQQLQDFRQARRADLVQLATALQSGDTAGAKQAYDALVALGKNGPNNNGAVSQRSDRAQAFDAIGAALQSGDSAGAKQAFATLACSFEHPPVALPPAPSSTPVSAPPEIIINLGGANDQSGSNPEIIVNTGSGNNSGTPTSEEIQINFGNGNTAGGQLKIDVSQSQTGEHVTIDFLQHNNDYHVALDLFTHPATSSAQVSALSLHA